MSQRRRASQARGAGLGLPVAQATRKQKRDHAGEPDNELNATGKSWTWPLEESQSPSPQAKQVEKVMGGRARCVRSRAAQSVIVENSCCEQLLL